MGFWAKHIFIPKCAYKFKKISLFLLMHVVYFSCLFKDVNRHYIYKGVDSEMKKEQNEQLSQKDKKIIFYSAIGFVVCMVVIFIFASFEKENAENDGKIEVATSLDEFEDMTYEEAENTLRDAGFTNIALVPNGELITGWLNHEGDVETVLIDGSDSFSSSSRFDPDVSIEIRYYSFPEESQEESLQEESNSEESVLEESSVGSTGSEESKAVEDVIYTVDNCDDFTEVLNGRYDDVDLIQGFVDGYEGTTIQFDACVVFIANHGDYNTRYDLLLYAGDYVDENTVNPGPVFRFKDVNVSDMGISDLFLPDFLSVGSNVLVMAVVEEYDPDQGLLFLDPIEVSER